VRKVLLAVALCAFVFGVAATPQINAQVTLLAVGSLTRSQAGSYADLSGLHNALESAVPANLLGGLGSGFAYASGNTFLGLPDRGPNADQFDDNIDSTTSYIPRFHTITMDLKPGTGSGLPFSLTPTLRRTTLLFSLTPLVYGLGDGIVGSGVPPQNNFLFHFFTGRSDAFDPVPDPNNSGNPRYARLDPEGIRLSNDGLSVFISDEYGPYVYQFDRLTGLRLRAFKLPANLFSPVLSSQGAIEISANTTGRVANKGMEGLAITPDGKTLVGIMQNALIQDASLGGAAKSLLRIVTIDIRTGTTHEYGYLLTSGTGVSEILALNQHEFLVDERDGKGRGDNGSKAKTKQIFKIDLANAVDITDTDGLTAATSFAVPKSSTPFLDVVAVLTAPPLSLDPTLIPSKIEGIALGPDVFNGRTKLHTLWVANDNDFEKTVPDANGVQVDNPSQFFVFGFTDADLAGSQLVPQQFKSFRW
jgi:phytase-like protein